MTSAVHLIAEVVLVGPRGAKALLDSRRRVVEPGEFDVAVGPTPAQGLEGVFELVA